MKILFVSLFNDECYGVRILHSVLVNSDYDCKMLFVKKYNESLFIKSIMDFGPDVLCFSIVSPYFDLYKTIYNNVRLKIKGIKIVVGGWHPTLDPESCRGYSDIVCVGEGQKSILEIVSDIKHGTYKEVYDSLTLCSDINHPMLLFDNKYCVSIDNNTIAYEEPYFVNNRYGTMIGRGCSHSCTYCSNSYMKKKYKDWTKTRYRNLDFVLDELRSICGLSSSVERINFYDEIFQGKQAGFDIFLEKYKKEIKLPFCCMFYPGYGTEDLVRKLRAAGLSGVWLGVQSGSERVRREVFKRYYTNQKLFEQIDIFRKFGISIRYDFIFNNPYETEEEHIETLRLIKRLPEPYSINMFSLRFFPNTDITHRALSDGLIKNAEYQNFSFVVDEERRKEIFEEIKRLGDF